MKRLVAAGVALLAFAVPAAARAQSSPAPYRPLIVVPSAVIDRALASPKPHRKIAKKKSRAPAPRPSVFLDPDTFGTVKTQPREPGPR
ncbi:MAG: hypothetical protein NVSMB64_25850 [Candidatus Velthaea sp.]